MGRTKDATAWTNDEDLALVEIMLRYIREGKMIKDAYGEAERIIPGRSAGACKNQWTMRLSKVYDQSIEQAKLQRMAYIEKEEANGGNTVSPEIKLPQNRPINSVSDAMEKALTQTREKRVGKVTPPAGFEIIEPAKQKKETAVTVEEIPVVTGVQQEIDFEKNVITDSKEEKSPDNPFLRIRKFVSKMEREYGDMTSENQSLHKDINLLKDLLHREQVKNGEARTTISEQEQQIVTMQSEVEGLREQLDQAQKEIESFAEIKELIKQFNSLNQ